MAKHRQYDNAQNIETKDTILRYETPFSVLGIVQKKQINAVTAAQRMEHDAPAVTIEKDR